MRAQARVVAEADGHGGTRLTRVRGEVPLLLRRTGPAGPVATVRLVGGAAGPLGGDDLRLDVEVGPDATLCLGTVAASVALPARSAAASRFVVVASVAAGGTLHWLPEQTVAAAGCRHRSDATVELAAGASLLWRDELVCGRYDEPSGELGVTTRVRYAGRPLLHQTLTVGSGAGWDGPAVLGGAKATGSLLRVGAEPPAAPLVLGPNAVRVPLAGPATLVVATADSAHVLRGYLPDCRHDVTVPAQRVSP